ncbi:hypothetical protein [Roseospira goensis]|uniref:Uncharacterized protein n=1 Tax=Roseospira goensis TaxID=391922 RepID=A0A7W6S2Q3_9PROT|nr:hypothetical protein [Roseospira goensis]MBB4287109.1 hypothetical protein [Roseospira goensis]
MDAYGDTMSQRDTEATAPDSRPTAAVDAAQAAVAAERRAVRARLNGMPCLVTIAPENTLTGTLAVPPFAGERAPLPAKGQRATLELVDETGESPVAAPQAEVDGAAAVEPIELTVSAANRRSGRFAARFLALTEEQSRLLARLLSGPVPQAG